MPKKKGEVEGEGEIKRVGQSKRGREKVRALYQLYLSDGIKQL